MQTVGTGTRAFTILPGHFVSYLSGTCAHCGQQTSFYPAREWLTLVWIPVFPLGLATTCSRCEHAVSNTAEGRAGALSLLEQRVAYPGEIARSRRKAFTYWPTIIITCLGCAGVGYALTNLFVRADSPMPYVTAFIGWMIGVWITLEAIS